jgi:Secretion system C-terminal sorting domain
MKKQILLLITIIALCCKVQYGIAQCGSLSASVSTTESRCTATGSIILNASGGAAPQSYQYRLSAGPITTAFTSSNIISGLLPGTYTAIVRDVTANCTITITNIIVAGTYVAPSIFYSSTPSTCMNGSNATISVTSQSGGRAPFSYQIIAPSPSHIGTISSTGTFTGLIAGSYRIEMTDSCGAVQTRDQVINPYTWSFNGNPTVTKPSCQNIRVNISLTNSNGIISPNAVYTGFQYGISRFAGDTTWFASVPFDFNIGTYRTAKIVVKDNCGSGIQSFTWTDNQPSINNTITADNLACSTFRARVQGQTNITAASTTYCLYNSTNTVLISPCQSSAIFNNVPYGSYTIRTIDACYDTTILRTITVAKPIPSVAAAVTTSNFTCTSFTATITGQTNMTAANTTYCLYNSTNTVLISACQSSPVFNNVPYGSYTIRTVDACYDTTILRSVTASKLIPSVAAAVATSNLACSTFTATITGQTNMTAATTTYCLYDITNTTPIGVCQSSPVFNNLPYGSYTIRTVDACNDTTILRTVTGLRPVPSLAANPIFTNTCSSFSATSTGQTNISNIANNYCIYTNGSAIADSCNSTGIFRNLAYGASYCIRLQNNPACYDTIISRCFNATRPVQSVNNNPTISGTGCSTFNVTIGGATNLNNPVYRLFNGANNTQIGADQTSNVFNNVPYGSYCIRIVNDPVCFDTTITRCFTVNKPVPSVNNNVTRNNRTCTAFTATVGGLTNLNNPIYRLFNSANNVQIGADQTSNIFNLLPYGSYCIRIVNDPACYDTTILKCFTEAAPPSTTNISLTPQRTCALIGGTDIRVNLNAGVAPFICKIYSPAGVLLNTSPATSAATYTFTSMPGLPVGAQYKVVTTDACSGIDSATATPLTYFINRTITKITKCPSGTNPNGTSDVTINVNGTENIGGVYAITIIKKDGVLFNQAPTSTANNGRTANFLSLVPGTYIFQTDPSGCPASGNVTDTVIVPNYIYPNLTNSTGFQCDNGSQTVAGTVLGGAPPYQYQIFESIPAFPAISTPYQNSPVFNFNNGVTYSLVRLRVLDNCGNASINDVAFFPVDAPIIQQQGNCFLNSITLSVDTIAGAAYTWYKRTYNPTDSILAGAGKELIIPLFQPSDTGTYICKTVFGGGCATKISSKYVSATGCATLPLSLLSFAGSKQTNYNQLQWKTANEINTKEFILERSADGRIFNRIAKVAAKGNGSYSYDDNTQLSGRIYYRLKMLDNDGRFTYSNIIVLTNQSNTTVTVYPNPVTDKTTLQFSDNKLLNSSAKLTDMSGRLVSTILIKNNFEIIEMGRLPSGIYMLQLADGTVQKIVKE